MRPLTRRQLLVAGVALLATGCSSTTSRTPTTTTPANPPTSSTTTALPATTDGTVAASAAPTPASSPASLPDPSLPAVDFADPFTLGVASGDPDATSVVLWTRLAPDPSRADGGLTADDVVVRWELSADAGFATLLDAGDTTAATADAHSVHVVVDLPDDGAHWYRFRVGQHTSPIGRTSRAPSGAIDRAVVASASCQNFEAGFYAAHRDLAAQQPDLVVWLGDYIYEAAAGAYGDAAVRSHVTAEAADLDGYRLRYALYKTDADLQAAHRACPWLVIWDDHEVQDNYAGLTPKDPAQAERFPVRRAAAYRAWWEHMPVRLPRPTQLERDPTAEYRTYRDAMWGDLLGLALLDGRQYRSDQACGDELLSFAPPCAEMAGPQRTMLGTAQEQWLAASFGTWGTTWNVLGNQTVLTDLRVVGAVLNPDQWDGYPAARDRLLAQLSTAATPNVVVLTGDIHVSIIGQLKVDGRPVGVEVVSTSISTGSFLTETYAPLVRLLPQVVDADLGHRGYCLHTVSHDEWRTELRLVDDARLADSAVSTHATYVVEAGTNTIRRASVG